MTAAWEIRVAERVAKGRPAFRHVWLQVRRDRDRYPHRETLSPDPILDLFVAREWARLKPCDPFTQQRYGEIRQRVVSPVFLPGARNER